MFLISIDPHIKKSTLAIFYCGELREIITVDTKKFNKNPLKEYSSRTNDLLALSLLSRPITEKHLVIERPWVGKSPKGSISLAITVGKIMGSLIRSGFEVHEAPAWGNDNSWISDMLSLGRRMPTREQVAKLSIQIVRSQYKNIKIDEHSAAAVLIGLWFLRKIKLKQIKKYI